MAENDTHYNDTPGENTQTGKDAVPAGNDYGLTTPLPDFEEGGPVYPDNIPNQNDSGRPVIPLPDFEEGGPVYPDSNMGPGPVIPLPFPGEGGPVYPGGSSGGHQHGWLPGRPSIPSLPPRFLGQVRFLNASSNSFPVNISIDGTPYAVNSRFGTISTYDWISDGFHTVTVRRTNGLRSVLLQQNFPFIAGQKITMILTDSAFGGLEMIRVSDMGCTNLPSGSGCYRFANMTCSGSRFDLLLYGGETVFRNVGFQSVTPYKQAMAGSYQFYITSSSSYTFLKEIPVLVLGAIGIGSNLPQPLVSFQTDIASGRNYTSYLIGNTWSDLGLRVMTVEDNA